MTIIEKIKAEIERRKGICMAQIKANPGPTFPFIMEMTGYDKILSFLSTLESEHLADARKTSPEDLEEAARHSEILTYPMPEDGDIEKVFKVQEARVFHEIGFIAGAKWQADHTPLPEDTVLFNKGVEEGKRLMMEEAVEGRVWNDYMENFGYCLQINLGAIKGNEEIHDGDKVRIIIVKED